MAAATEALDLTGRMIAGPVPIRDWLVIAPVVIPITMGALTMMFRHRIRTHAATALASLAAMVVANAFLLIRWSRPFVRPMPCGTSSLRSDVTASFPSCS